MIARASCLGAATIVNAIATGRGAAFGIRLRADAEANLARGLGELDIDVGPEEAGPALVAACVARLSKSLGQPLAGRVATRSEIPVSRGLKSSSAAANAVVLAATRSLRMGFDDLEVVNLGVDAALDAGVTITGAFDDACAAYFGGVVLTDNRQRKILRRDHLPSDLLAVLAIPDGTVAKPSLRGVDFFPIAHDVAEAFDLALKGDYGPALERNGHAYCRLLGIDPGPGERARRAGALAAGLTGTGPAFVALCRQDDAKAVARAMASDTVETRIVPLNGTKASEVVS